MTLFLLVLVMPRDPGGEGIVIGPKNAWEFADEKLRELRAKIKLAEAGDYDGNVAVMRDMLDKWLEYRQDHGPGDERLPL